MSDKTYLGDGVYVVRNEFNEVVLTTEDGINTTNTICLEREVLAALLTWLTVPALPPVSGRMRA